MRIRDAELRRKKGRESIARRGPAIVPKVRRHSTDQKRGGKGDTRPKDEEKRESPNLPRKENTHRRRGSGLERRSPADALGGEKEAHSRPGYGKGKRRLTDQAVKKKKIKKGHYHRRREFSTR